VNAFHLYNELKRKKGQNRETPQPNIGVLKGDVLPKTADKIK